MIEGKTNQQLFIELLEFNRDTSLEKVEAGLEKEKVVTFILSNGNSPSFKEWEWYEIVEGEFTESMLHDNEQQI